MLETVQPAASKMVSNTVHRFRVPLASSLVPALLLVCSSSALSCQIEYSDWLVNVFRQQGSYLEKRTGSFSNLAECEAAMRQAVAQSGDPSLANNMRCVDCNPPTVVPQNPSSPSYQSGPSDISGQQNQSVLGSDQNSQAFKQEKQRLIQGLKGGSAPSLVLDLKTSGSTGSVLTLKTGIAPVSQKPTHTSEVVRQEQNEFDQMQAEWLRKQQELIRKSVARDKGWRNEVLASIKAVRVPNPAARPKALDDLRPGDILLIGPDDSLIASTIKTADPLYRALDYFVSGNVSAPELKQGKASHVLTFVRKIKDELLFLDHTLEGSRVINEKELMRRYENRLAYIAKPQAKVDGRKLWEAAREAALQQKSDYGVFGSSVVCSERAAIAVAKATGVAMDKESHGFGLGGVDITPSDFFDEKHIGKFFLVSTSPIVLRP